MIQFAGNSIVHFFNALFLTKRFFLAGMFCFILFTFSYLAEILYAPAVIISWIFLFVLIADIILLFSMPKTIVKRQVHSRMSNGDENPVVLHLKNLSPLKTTLQIIDELPVQFQVRDFMINTSLKGSEKKQLKYNLRPTERGEYFFGNIHVFIASTLGLLRRRITINAQEKVSVYPSYIQLRNYQLLTGNTINASGGNKKIRKVGNSFEFEQVKDYVIGDDIRKLNWKATARNGMMMVNQYTDEKSQQVFIIIDKGRLMKMPFEGLTLLDYAINSALVLTHVCLQKQDKIGLITFAEKFADIVPADRKMTQREIIVRSLYNQNTTFLEADFEMLYMQVRAKIKQRSMLILFTNFETLTGVKRQMQYLRSLSKHHLLLVVFFENTSLKQLSAADAETVEDVYVKTIADKFIMEKRLIVKELHQAGILSLLTTPQELTVQTINSYVDLKSRQLI